MPSQETALESTAMEQYGREYGRYIGSKQYKETFNLQLLLTVPRKASERSTARFQTMTPLTKPKDRDE